MIDPARIVRFPDLPQDTYLVRGWCSPALGPVVVSETLALMRAQLTFRHGWPGRADRSHTMARFGDANVTYDYRGKAKPVHPWTPGLTVVNDLITADLGWRANCCCVNTYAPDGDLFPHNDSKYIPQLGPDPTIVSVSFGATRRFNLLQVNAVRRRTGLTVSVALGDGDLFVMSGACDRGWLHGIASEPGVTGNRTSLTFRQHLITDN